MADANKLCRGLFEPDLVFPAGIAGEAGLLNAFRALMGSNPSSKETPRSRSREDSGGRAALMSGEPLG